MNKKLTKNQWVAVIAALIVMGIIVFISYGTFPGFQTFESDINISNQTDINSSSEHSVISNFENMVAERNFQNVQVLEVIDLIVGIGEQAETGDTVLVNYIGVLTDGTKFDSTFDRQTPFEFTIGSGFVIEGWDLGVVGMKAGGIRGLIIPPNLGYGSTEVGLIPADSVLIFAVELLEIRN
jgi:peptidylprolyl isomerase